MKGLYQYEEKLVLDFHCLAQILVQPIIFLLVRQDKFDEFSLMWPSFKYSYLIQCGIFLCAPPHCALESRVQRAFDYHFCYLIESTNPLYLK